MADIRRRIAQACARSGREVSSVTLIGVTKTVPPERLREAIAAGLTVFGENRVQEAAAKIRALHALRPAPPATIRWHLVGTLQRNKACQAVELFDLIHSVDSLAVAEAVARQARRLGKCQSALVQVNVTGEAGQHGVRPEEAEALAEAVAAMPGLALWGFMTIGPLGAAPETTRAAFRRLRQIRDDAVARHPAWRDAGRELSMGMSDDFEIAVEEGATMVRVGRALFGERW